MTTNEFNEFFEGRINGIRQLACSKNEEYATRYDHFRNFNQGAKITGLNRDRVLWGFFIKHFISIQDYILHNATLSPCQVDEKINDMIIYLLLLAGMLVESEGRLIEPAKTPNQ